jgi:IS4 transposase
VSVGVLTRVFPPDLVDEVVAGVGRTEQRHRSLPARVMAYFSIGMALYSEGSYEDVLGQLTDGLSWASGWRESYRPPSKSAIFQARARLGPEPVAALFEVTAVDLAAAYTQRWEIELAFDELKTHQRGPRTVLRSKSPDLVLQEIWGHLCCHYAIRSLMSTAAEHAGHDPDRVSFVAALRIIRQTLAHPGAFPP